MENNILDTQFLRIIKRIMYALTYDAIRFVE